MPCDNVAVAGGKLKTNIAAFLKEDEALVKALVAHIESLTTARPVNVNTKLTGYIEITVGYDAILTIQDGGNVRARSVRLTRNSLDALTTKVTDFCDKIGKAMGPERAVRAIKKRYGADSILSDQRMGTARVVKIRI